MTDQQPNLEVSSDDKLWALLAYVLTPIIPIVILLMEDKKNRPYLKMHNAQALILGIIAVALSWACIGFIVWLGAVFCGIQAYNGKPVVIPVITDFCKSQGWS